MTLAFKARKHDPTIASFRYRVLAPVRFLAARGHAVEVFDERRIEAYEAVVFSKSYRKSDQNLARELKRAGKRVILDLCDNHFHNPAGDVAYEQARGQMLEMIRLADQVTCSTRVLAEAVKAEAGLAALPAVAPDLYEPAGLDLAPPRSIEKPARLLWFGRHGSPNAPAGMADLLLVREPLERAHALRPIEVVVCSDSKAKHEELFADFPVPTRYVTWTPQSFAAELARCDAVLIPLSDNPFVAAKTHNRLSLALSAGAPVVSDRLDSYEEFAPFCWLGDWGAGLEEALLRPEAARARAAGALAYLEAHWSETAVAPAWEAALGLKHEAQAPSRVVLDARPELTPFSWWLRQDGRNERPWLIVGNQAPLELVREAAGRGYLVMTVGKEIRRCPAEVAYVTDLETVHAFGEGIGKRARMLLMPAVPHVGGWAGGRSLESWAVDTPVLARLRMEGRLLSFALWTGSAEGVFGELAGCEIPLRLLQHAGVADIRQLGFDPPDPPQGEATSILERRVRPNCPAYEI
jgi:hypothetical protein